MKTILEGKRFHPRLSLYYVDLLIPFNAVIKSLECSDAEHRLPLIIAYSIDNADDVENSGDNANKREHNKPDENNHQDIGDNDPDECSELAAVALSAEMVSS